MMMMWRLNMSITSVSTVYHTEASDSLCFKFLDGLCTTVIEVKIPI